MAATIQAALRDAGPPRQAVAKQTLASSPPRQASPRPPPQRPSSRRRTSCPRRPCPTASRRDRKHEAAWPRRPHAGADAPSADARCRHTAVPLPSGFCGPQPPQLPAPLPPPMSPQPPPPPSQLRGWFIFGEPANLPAEPPSPSIQANLPVTHPTLPVTHPTVTCPPSHPPSHVCPHILTNLSPQPSSREARAPPQRALHVMWTAGLLRRTLHLGPLWVCLLSINHRVLGGYYFCNWSMLRALVYSSNHVG